jgi:hypothetical protein
LKDRGPGIATSMFGTYIEKNDLIIYPFYEYYYDRNAEYKPAELGFTSENDYRGKYVAHEGILYFGYGISDWLMIEGEAAVITARQNKGGNDRSDFPDSFSEQGLGDVEGQLRWRYWKETFSTPELFSYFETVLPLNKNKKLIGTSEWEHKFGSGLMKGFSWGTMTVRAAVEYVSGENKVETGEFALEYLKRVNEKFRFYIGVEGTQDELGLITDLQIHLQPWIFIRINNSFGLSSKATDYAPELGMVFYVNKM